MGKLSLALMIALGGCVGLESDPVDELSQVDQNLDSPNGKSLNGTSLNGTSLNGKSLNGTSLNGTSLNGKSLNGTSIAAVSTTAPPLTGAAVVGSTWTGTASNGATIALRIDTALQGTASNADLWFYGVSYQTSAGWSPVCGLDITSAPIKAVPVAGIWNTSSATYVASATQFTFACRGNTVAKCVEMGYKTFKGYTTQLASCVRLLRADYCGTGASYTVNGTLLNLYDSVGVQLDTETWAPEAEWTPTGARCINKNNSARFNLLAGKDPKCVEHVLTTSTCGTNFQSGAVLIDELPQQ